MREQWTKKIIYRDESVIDTVIEGTEEDQPKKLKWKSFIYKKRNRLFLMYKGKRGGGLSSLKLMKVNLTGGTLYNWGEVNM